MTRTFHLTALLALILFAGPLFGADMRASSIEASKIKEQMLERARMEKEAAQKQADQVMQDIYSDRARLKSSISDLEKSNVRISAEIKELQGRIKELRKRNADLADELSEMDARTKELAGFVRAAARDAESLVSQSQQSVFISDRVSRIKTLATGTRFPSMAQINYLAETLFDEIAGSGEVRVQTAPIVNRAGEEVEALVLVLGNFSAAYRWGDETGFLLYSDKSRRFFALSAAPSVRMSKKIIAYMEGESEDAPMDISRGGALRRMTREKKLAEQIPDGGPIVWVIAGLAAAAFLIILERSVFLFRASINPEKFMLQVKSMVKSRDWDECLDFCEKQGSKPVPKVIAWGVRHRRLDRPDLENALQEAILGEIPRLERFLSTLAMTAAIAPLLGLLGTVTGMINTFHVITYYGAGDPKMMSGGISEALITTMLGLAAAIPIMLAHTLLSGRVEAIISQMEEKAVAFVNAVFASE